MGRFGANKVIGANMNKISDMYEVALKSDRLIKRRS